MCEERPAEPAGRPRGPSRCRGHSYRHDRPVSAFLTESGPDDSGGQYTLATPAVTAMPDNLQKLARFMPARGDDPASPKALVHAGPPTLAVPIARRRRRKWAAARGITVVMMRLGGRRLSDIIHMYIIFKS